MSSNRIKKEKKTKLLKIVIISILAFALGYYMLFYVSRMLKPILGNTFHILMGCILISVSVLVLFVNLKSHFFPKRKTKRSNVVFLEDELKKTKRSN